jgi:hypothetical protein
MRWSRLAITTALLALVVLGAGLTVAASGSGSSAHRARVVAASRAPARVAAPRVVAPPQTLQGPLAQLRGQLSQLRGQFSSGHRGRALPRVITVIKAPPNVNRGSGSCFIAGGPCSLTPCVEFAGGNEVSLSTATASTVATSDPVVMTVGSTQRVAPRGQAGSCHAPAKIERVSYP